MLEVAVLIIQHVDRLCISYISNKVMPDLLRIISNYTKSKGNLLALYIEPIACCLMVLINDINFSVENFTRLHCSIMAKKCTKLLVTTELISTRHVCLSYPPE